MIPQLSDIECRILGCLIEKEITTPEYYPLTINSLTNACNQKSNRNPVLHLTDTVVEATVEGMKEKHLVWQRHVAGARTLKYEHNLPGVASFTSPEIAILGELLLRGPQTPGELRNRAGRMYNFQGLDEVEATLLRLINEESGPYVIELPKVRGTKECRFAHLFAGQPLIADTEEVTPDENRPVAGVVVEIERIAALETEVALLRNDLESLKEKLSGLLS